MTDDLASYLDLLSLAGPGAAARDPRPAAVLDRDTARIHFFNAAFARLAGARTPADLLDRPTAQAAALAGGIARHAGRFFEDEPAQGVVRLSPEAGGGTVRFALAPVAPPAGSDLPDRLVLATLLDPAADADADDPLSALADFLSGALPVTVADREVALAPGARAVPVGGGPLALLVGERHAAPAARAGSAKALIAAVRQAFDRRAASEATAHAMPVLPAALEATDAPAEADGGGLSGSEQEAFRAIASALGARLPEDASAGTAGSTPGALVPLPRDAPAERTAEAALLDRVPMPLLVVRDGRVVSANPAALDLLGHADAAAIEAAGGLEALMAGPLPATDGGERKVALARADGESVAANARLAAIPFAGGGALLLALEPQRAAAGGGRQALAAMGAFADGLRTPLGAIAGMAGIVRDERLGALPRARYRHYADAIGAEACRLLAEAERLSTYARIALGRAPVGAERVDLGASLVAVRRAAGPALEAADAKASLVVADGLPPVETDPDLLETILAELVAGAARRARGGSVWIDASPAGEGGIRITVRDDGPGFDATAMAVALDPFGLAAGGARAEAGAAPADLSLAIASAAARRLGLAFRASSDPRAGTTVEIDLPAAGDGA